MKKMKNSWVILISACVAICAAFAVHAGGATNPPMKLIQSIPLPGVDGDFDHFGVDLKGNRLFSCAEGNGTVEVFDMATNKHIGSIGKGVVKEPHSLLYREDLNRLYVVDGTHEIGAVRIFDAKTYSWIKNIDLPAFADWSAYDPATKYLYVNGDGAFVKKPVSTISIIDTTSGDLAGQITVDDDVITGLALDSSNAKLYTGMRGKKVVGVIDLKTRKVDTTWPFSPNAGNPGFMEIDTANHRLFENFANHRVKTDPSPGQKYQHMVVYDTQTGKPVTTIPINELTDHLQYDGVTKRVYIVAAVPPSVQVFRQVDPDHYESLGEVPTETKARCGISVRERNRFYVAVPKQGNKEAHILAYEVL